MSCWYTRKELALRCAILYTGQTLAYCCAGLIAAGIFASLENTLGLAGWQWLFIILASVGAFIALIAAFILPDYPLSKTGSARWTMTEDMRTIANVRIIADRPSTEEGQAGVWQGLKLSLLDYKLWILAILNVGLSAAYGFSNFFPPIVRGFGYSNTITLLLTAPPYVREHATTPSAMFAPQLRQSTNPMSPYRQIFAAIGSLINALHSDKKRERGYHYITPVSVGCIGFIVCLATQNRDARYAASFIYVGGMYIANPLTSTWCSSTMSKTPEKRAASVALFNILGQIGNFVAPYFFVEDDEPRYQLAFIMMMVMAGMTVSAALVLKFVLRRANRKIYEKAVREGSVYQPYVL